MHARRPTGHRHHPAREARRAHEPRHAFLADPRAPALQHPMNARAPVGPVGAAMDVFDALEQRGVGLRPRA